MNRTKWSRNMPYDATYRISQVNNVTWAQSSSDYSTRKRNMLEYKAKNLSHRKRYPICYNYILAHNTHARTQTDTHARTHTIIQTYAHTHTHTHTHKHIHVHAYRQQTYIYTSTDRQIHTQTHTPRYTHKHKQGLVRHYTCLSKKSRHSGFSPLKKRPFWKHFG